MIHFIFIADMHAITTMPIEAEKLKRKIYEI